MAGPGNVSPDGGQDAEEAVGQEATPARTSPSLPVPSPAPAAGKYRLIFSCIFFGLFYIYVWKYVNPNVLYYANGLVAHSGQRTAITFPVYARGMAFFEEFLTRPGGLAEYAGAFNSQYYYYPHVGALILTAVGWLVYLAGDRLIHAMGGTGARSLRFVAPLLLLITYNRYTFHIEDYLSLFAALALASVYVHYAGRRESKAGVRLVLFVVLSAALYYAAGGPYVLFAVLCGLFELLSKRRIVVGGLYILAAAALPVGGKYLFDIPLAEAYLRPSGLYPLEDVVKVMAISAVYLLFVLVAIVLPFRAGLLRLVSALAGRVGAYYGGSRLRIACPVLLLAIASAAVCWLTLDRDGRTLLRANYFARQGMWREVLVEAGRYPPRKHTVYLTHDVNRALFETGQLGSKMFSYPQKWQTLIPRGEPGIVCFGSTETLFRLGGVNQAGLTGLEAIEWGGERAQFLRCLAMAYVVKDQPETARVFLNAARKDILHGKWAENCLRRLDEDPHLYSQREVSYVRSVALVEHRVFDSEEGMFLALLARNKKNRMAFEYLMAHYLLTRQLGKIVANIVRLSDFDYPAIPEHYAEAILLYTWGSGRRPNLYGRTIGKPTLKRFRRFYLIVTQSKGNIRARNEGFAAAFPNSYFRYCLAGEFGGTQ